MALVAKLTGPALDWVVGTCEGERVFRLRIGRPTNWDGAAYRAGDTSDERWVTRAHVPNVSWFADYEYNPSANWLIGGPIIEREAIATYPVGSGWRAEKLGQHMRAGPTPLVAAMRCYVSSKLGDEVEIPLELQPTATTVAERTP